MDDKNPFSCCGRINNFVARSKFWWDWYLSTNLEIARLIASVKTYCYMYWTRGKRDDRHPFYGCANINDSMALFGRFLYFNEIVTYLLLQTLSRLFLRHKYSIICIETGLNWFRSQCSEAMRTDAPVLHRSGPVFSWSCELIFRSRSRSLNF
jgi:hypothetical protein